MLEGARLMATIQLTREETEMMQDILESYLSDLRLEIGDTENSGFQEELKNKESFLTSVLVRLTAAVGEDFLI
jgi:hypothetical protein